MTDSNFEENTEATDSTATSQRNNKQTLLILAVAVLLFALGAFYFINRNSALNNPPFVLQEIGVAIYPDESLDLAYVSKRVSGVGNVMLMTTKSIQAAQTAGGTTTPECYLGGYFMLDKGSLVDNGANIDEEEVRRTIDSSNPESLGVQELDTMFLIFEPSTTTCTDDVEKELRDREYLIEAVETAKEV